MLVVVVVMPVVVMVRPVARVTVGAMVLARLSRAGSCRRQVSSHLLLLLLGALVVVVLMVVVLVLRLLWPACAAAASHGPSFGSRLTT